MNRLAVAEALRELGRLLEATGAPLFRVRAHERAARTVEQLGEETLERYLAEGKLQDLPNIGPSLSDKIERLCKNGGLPELEILREKVPSGFRELSRVEGLGPKRILALHWALGIENLDDLQRAVEQKKIREVKGFSASTEERLVAAIAAVRARGSRYLWLEAVREARRLLPRI